MTTTAQTLPQTGTVHVLLREDDRPGHDSSQMRDRYSPVTVKNADECDHIETVCTSCLETWQADYHVRASA